jgi:hypothetical protein
MTGQCHETQDAIDHPRRWRNAPGGGEEHDSDAGIEHEQPDERGHDSSGLI